MALVTARKTILEAFKARLEAIRVTSGYNTDAGEHVFIGETVVFGEGDPAYAIAIVPAEQNRDFRGTLKSFSQFLVEIQIVLQTDARQPWLVIDSVVIEDPWLVIEAALQDIKRAVEVLENGKKTIAQYRIEAGQVRTVSREPGRTEVGAGVTYAVMLEETWGAP